MEKNIQVKSYSRKVTYSKVTWSCLWCGEIFSDERFPGSFVPILCESCRTIYRSWQRANYHRRTRGINFLPLKDWIADQRVKGKVIPEVKGDIDSISKQDSLSSYHTPATRSDSHYPIVSNRSPGFGRQP